MRPAHARIDLSALQHNFDLAKQLQNGPTLAVVKADAYGHGATACAQALMGRADGFAVSCIEEALELRAAGMNAPILLLEGFFQASELAVCVEQDFWVVLHASWQLEAIEAAELTAPLNCWIKIDTGMHRIGFVPSEVASVYQRLQDSQKVQRITLMTHMAQADHLESEFTQQQLAVFQAAIAGLDVDVSFSNSAMLLGWGSTTQGWGRPGIMLYGCSPFGQACTELQPVMTLESEIIAVRELPAGESVGYGGRFVTQRATRLGVVAMGYGDGYPRHAKNGTPVWVAGQRAPLVGTVSMDLITIDITDVPYADVGSRVELWGRNISADEVASCAETISYTLLTGVKRVRKDWLKG